MFGSKPKVFSPPPGFEQIVKEYTQSLLSNDLIVMSGLSALKSCYEQKDQRGFNALLALLPYRISELVAIDVFYKMYPNVDKQSIISAVRRVVLNFIQPEAQSSMENRMEYLHGIIST